MPSGWHKTALHTVKCSLGKCSPTGNEVKELINIYIFHSHSSYSAYDQLHCLGILTFFPAMGCAPSPLFTLYVPLKCSPVFISLPEKLYSLSLLSDWAWCPATSHRTDPHPNVQEPEDWESCAGIPGDLGWSEAGVTSWDSVYEDRS